jgi:uncharacterized membrane protein
MVDVLTEITINRPVAHVATFACDPDNAPKWYVNIRSAEWRTQRPLVVGSRIAFVAHFLGRKLAYTYEVVEYIPQQRMVMRTAEGPFPMCTTYEWSAVLQGGTRMTLRNSGEPSGFSKWFAPLLAGMMRRANAKDLKNLKRILEDRP